LNTFKPSTHHKAPSFDQALADAALRLAGTSPTPHADAQILLAHVLGRERSHLVAWPEKVLEDRHAEAFRQLVAQRLRGVPVAYLTGHKEFWSLSLRVDASTLIPRPETETLVEFALDGFDASTKLAVADLGTGSGAIACALASERPRWQIQASDICAAALAVAQANALALGLRNIDFVRGDWFAAFDAAARFDLVVGNPPYIAAADPHLGRGDLAHEPPGALVAGADGLDAIRRIASQAPRRLRPGGWLVLEHGYDQARAVADILRRAGFERVEQRRDLAGILRMTAGCLRPSA